MRAVGPDARTFLHHLTANVIKPLAIGQGNANLLLSGKGKVEHVFDLAREAENSPELLHDAPHDTPNTRLDEARAARRPDLRWKRQ